MLLLHTWICNKCWEHIQGRNLFACYWLMENQSCSQINSLAGNLGFAAEQKAAVTPGGAHTGRVRVLMCSPRVTAHNLSFQTSPPWRCELFDNVQLSRTAAFQLCTEQKLLRKYKQNFQEGAHSWLKSFQNRHSFNTTCGLKGGWRQRIPDKGLHRLNSILS